MSSCIYTYSAGGIVALNDEVLVIKSANSNIVDFPKGTIEEGESNEEAALREVAEETGYQAEILCEIGNISYDFDGKDGTRYRKTVFYFLMKPKDMSVVQKNLQKGEDFENEWLSFDDAEARLTYDDSRGILSQALILLSSQ